ncbi:MAG: VOC family protein [Bacteroidota bacterium]
MKNTNPVNWFDIHVANLEKAKAFYETVFNVQLEDFPLQWGKQSAFPSDRYGMNISGALVEKADFSENSNNTVVYFESQDCLKEESRVVAAGGEVLQSKMSIGEFGFVSRIKDVDGNVIGLHSLQ